MSQVVSVIGKPGRDMSKLVWVELNQSLILEETGQLSIPLEPGTILIALTPVKEEKKGRIKERLNQEERETLSKAREELAKERGEQLRNFYVSPGHLQKIVKDLVKMDLEKMWKEEEEKIAKMMREKYLQGTGWPR